MRIQFTSLAVAIIGVVCVQVSCATTPTRNDFETENSAAQTDATYVMQDILFCTTRRGELVTNDELEFGDKFASTSFGVSHTTIPATHQIGQLERPTLLDRTESSDNHVCISKTTHVAGQEWHQLIEAQLQQADSNEILIFVHGFNLTFDESVLRTTQFAYDVGFEGVVILFAWPSAGSVDVDAYCADQLNAMASIPALNSLVANVSQGFPNCRLNVFAHSLGCRMVVSTAISSRAFGSDTQPEAAQLTPMIDQLILAAPDIDQTSFEELGLVAAEEWSRYVTCLVNPNDLALRISAEHHGNRRRAGSVALESSTRDRTEYLNVGPMFEGRIAPVRSHMYFAVCPEVIQLISESLSQRRTDSLTGSLANQ